MTSVCECGHSDKMHNGNGAMDCVSFKCGCLVFRPKHVEASVAPAGASPVQGDAAYLALLDELRILHLKKAADYGTGTDPLANLRSTAELGIPPWVGCMVRLRDKFTRVCSFIQNDKLENESIEDNLKDMAAYCLLGLRLWKEQHQ